jgi:hypothetical protein
MDKQLLEFWGTMMLQAARGQQQLEEIMKWFSGNVKDFKDVSGMFCRMYGIEPGSDQVPDYLAFWQKALGEFRDSYGELIAMMDLVPRKDHVAVTRENQELKRRVSELEDAVRRLRALLDDKAAVPAGGIKDFQELIDEQARQYQDFMKGMTAAFDKRPEAEASETAGKPKKAKPEPVGAAKKNGQRGAKAVK